MKTLATVAVLLIGLTLVGCAEGDPADPGAGGAGSAQASAGVGGTAGAAAGGAGGTATMCNDLPPCPAGTRVNNPTYASATCSGRTCVDYCVDESSRLLVAPGFTGCVLQDGLGVVPDGTVCSAYTRFTAGQPHDCN